MTVYFAQAASGEIKIGWTEQQDARRRLSKAKKGAVAAGFRVPIKLLATTEGDRRLERALHRQLEPWRITGEWFRPSSEVLEAISKPMLQKLRETSQYRWATSIPPNRTLVQQSIRCGKPDCYTCPHPGYWYASWSEDGRTRNAYIGNNARLQELLNAEKLRK